MELLGKNFRNRKQKDIKIIFLNVASLKNKRPVENEKATSEWERIFSVQILNKKFTSRIVKTATNQ